MYHSRRGNGAQTSYQSAEHDVGGFAFQLLSNFSPTRQIPSLHWLLARPDRGKGRVHTENCRINLQNLPSCQQNVRILVSDPWKQRQTRGVNQWKRKATRNK